MSENIISDNICNQNIHNKLLKFNIWMAGKIVQNGRFDSQYQIHSPEQPKVLSLTIDKD